jgi:hypothetical protein
MKHTLTFPRLAINASLSLLTALCVGCTADRYAGTPFEDTEYKTGAQPIPGRVFCAYYDLGGEGIAYHDATPQNHGSGELNPLDGSYLHAFRAEEGVDTSYTKSAEETDSSAYNMVTPPMDQLYVGWTEPGEWTKYTVNVEQAGNYAVSLLYTSNRGGAIALDVNDAPVLSDVQIPTTYHSADSLAWRQWHHWNIAPLGEVSLKKGEQTITLHTAGEGQMNYGWLEFEPLVKQ